MRIDYVSPDQMIKEVTTLLDEIKAKLVAKNKGYGASTDSMHNFRQTALRALGNDDAESMYKVLMVYMDKHLCTLAKNGLADSEFEDRTQDNIVYSLLSIIMKRHITKKDSLKEMMQPQHLFSCAHPSKEDTW